MLNPVYNIYKNKIKIKKLKKFNFKAFKKVMPLKVFKAHYIRDFYTPDQLADFRDAFNIDQLSLDIALMKRSLLNRIVTQKYYAIFFPKEFPNRFRKKKRKYLRRKPKKKNLKLRIKFFYSIPQDNFLFYLSILDKQLLIKPFNFLNCLFFFKMRKFKKVYVVRKRRRLRFRFYYRFGRRRKKRRSVRRRRLRYLKYRFKKKFLIKRFRRIKIRKYKNFLRFIAFFNTCKKISLNIDDYFKVNSLLNLPYKLLRFNFNKMTNSYNFFLHFNNQRKSKITLGTINTKNIFIQKKTELYNIIKFKLKNRFFNLNNNLNNHLFETLNLDFVQQNPNLKFQINDYLNYYNVIKNSIVKNYQVNCLKNNFKNSQQNNQVFFILNLINKISKKISFFEQKRINFKLKEKKKLYLLFLKIFNSNNKKCMKLFKNYQQILNNLFDIILKLKNKLKELIVTFYIIYFNNINNINDLLKKQKSKFLKKVLYFVKKKKKKQKQNLKKKQKLVLTFYENKNKIFMYKSKKIYFSYNNKLNNIYGIKKRWKLRKLKRHKIKVRKLGNVLSIKKKFVLTNFFLYKNYNSYFDKKNCKDMYLNFLKKSNVQHLIDLQKSKNINFLK